MINIKDLWMKLFNLRRFYIMILFLNEIYLKFIIFINCKLKLNKSKNNCFLKLNHFLFIE